MFSEFKHWNTPGQNPRILADPSKSAINLFPYQIAHAKITDETIKVWLKVRSSKVKPLQNKKGQKNLGYPRKKQSFS